MRDTVVVARTEGNEEIRRNGRTHEAQHASAAHTSQPKKTHWIAPVLLLTAVLAVGAGLAVWKMDAFKKAAAAASQQPEPIEVAALATAKERQHRRTSTSIGTVVALRSITLRNEIPGSVHEVNLQPGQIVEPGTVLVALDVSVEQAELKAQEAQAALAKTLAERMDRAVQSRATSQMEADRARAELDVARAQSERIKAIIARKTIRAPFRARIGISDVHVGQYLNEGTTITTLQGVDEGTHVDFQVPQHVALALKEGDAVEILAGAQPVQAKVVALDSRVDQVTRNTTVRARVDNAASVPAPGASVRVRAAYGEPIAGVVIPVNALRKGPAGDHVFTLVNDKDGKQRAQTRRVQTAASLGDEVLIIEGLKPGETVAASGSFKLRDGVLVAPAPNQGAPEAAQDAKK
jgi:membrane fusion protein (multidrug efflux system)